MNVDLPAGAAVRPMIGDEFDLETMRGRVSAAVLRAEAEALRAHEAGECHLSEWSCSHCDADDA